MYTAHTQQTHTQHLTIDKRHTNMFAIYIYTKNPYIFYAFIIFITTALYTLLHNNMCFPSSLYRPTWFPLYRKKKTKQSNTPPSSPIAILMPPLHFLCSRRKRDTCRLRKTLYASMLHPLPLLLFLFLSLSPHTPKPCIHIHIHTTHTPPPPFKNSMFFCRKQSKIKIKPVDVMIAVVVVHEAGGVGEINDRMIGFNV